MTEIRMQEKIYRAGMIVYRVSGGVIEMLFMRPSDGTYGGDDFQIPKGRIESGEEPEEAAIREAQEEVGLFRSAISGPVHNLGTYLGRTTMFVCKVKPDAIFGYPDEETAETAWLTIEQFEAVGRDLHRPVIRAVYQHIKRLETADE